MENRKLSPEEIKNRVNTLPRTTIYEWITSREYDETSRNNLKISLLEKYTNSVKLLKLPEEQGFDDFDSVDLAIFNYCYVTSVGKEATAARKRFRQALIRLVAYSKWDDKAFLFEDDAGESYSRWCTLWIKEQDRLFYFFFGKDPLEWYYKIKDKFLLDRKQAEIDGLF